MTTMVCPVCSSPVVLNKLFSELPRVTSDSRPWPAGGEIACCSACGFVHKPSTRSLLEESDKIYSTYQMYELADGADQPIFDASGEAAPRSKRIVEFLATRPDLPSSGSLIDVGCGSGTALKVVSDALPNWILSGNDLTDAPRAELSKLPKFDRFYAGSLEEPLGVFDVVCLLHSLGHIERPVAEVMKLAFDMLSAEGHLLVATPDLETSPFDILIADNRSHFAAATLAYLATSAGFSIDFLSNSELPKELTLWAHKGQAPEPKTVPDPAAGNHLLEQNISWLAALLSSARQVRKESPKFGLFGTAISGTWLYGALDRQVDFFVDEDPNRIGKCIGESPILSPDQVPHDAKVYVPLAPPIADAVAKRFPAHGFVRPPAFFG